MAVYCRECRCVFSRRHINCPYCGKPPQEDSHTVQELVDSGFRLISAKRQSGGTYADPGPRTQAPDGGSDALERLRCAYQIDGTREQSRVASPSSDTDRSAVPPPSSSSREGGTDSLNDWLHGNIPGENSSTGPVQGAYHTVSPEPDPAHPATPQDSSDIQRFTYEEEELRRLRRSQQAYSFRSRVSSLFSSIALLPWRFVFRILLVVAAILLIGAFITAIPMILNDALNLILSLLPAILTILIIYWCLRNLFKR